MEGRKDGRERQERGREGKKGEGGNLCSCNFFLGNNLEYMWPNKASDAYFIPGILIRLP